jgi:hypothetical protein
MNDRMYDDTETVPSKEPVNEPAPVVDPVNVEPQPIDPPQPWDREFNCAIQVLGSAYLPRQFATTTDTSVPAWTRFKLANRPVVEFISNTASNGAPTADDINVTFNGVFADNEIEMTFNALVMQIMFSGKIAEKHDGHAPHICLDMVLGAADEISEALARNYGAKADLWRKVVYFLLPGQMAFRLLFGRQPAITREYIDHMTMELDGYSVLATRDAVRNILIESATMRAAMAAKTIDGEAEKETKPTIH